MSEAKRLLDSVSQGDAQAASELLPLVYEELRRLAVHKMANEAAGHTLQPTALVHEAWVRLVGNEGKAEFVNRAYFFAAAAEAMRRILVENARRKQRAKHGGGFERLDYERLDFETLDLALVTDDRRLLALDEALDKLAGVDKSSADLIKMRFFAGLSNLEAARLLGMSERTGKRTWAYARAWLYEELNRTL